MKIKLILELYDKLVTGYVVRSEFCRDHGIGNRTFYRYMKEISEYLKLFKRDCFIDLSGSDGKYILKRS